MITKIIGATGAIGAGLIGQPGSGWQQTYNQAQNQYSYQQALHGLAPGIRVSEPVQWMFDGTTMSLTEFADRVYGDDDAAKVLFLLKYR